MKKPEYIVCDGYGAIVAVARTPEAAERVTDRMNAAYEAENPGRAAKGYIPYAWCKQQSRRVQSRNRRSHEKHVRDGTYTMADRIAFRAAKKKPGRK